MSIGRQVKAGDRITILLPGSQRDRSITVESDGLMVIEHTPVEYAKEHDGAVKRIKASLTNAPTKETP